MGVVSNSYPSRVLYLCWGFGWSSSRCEHTTTSSVFGVTWSSSLAMTWCGGSVQMYHHPEGLPLPQLTYVGCLVCNGRSLATALGAEAARLAGMPTSTPVDLWEQAGLILVFIPSTRAIVLERQERYLPLKRNAWRLRCSELRGKGVTSACLVVVILHSLLLFYARKRALAVEVLAACTFTPNGACVGQQRGL